MTLDEGKNWCIVCEKQLEKPVRISEKKKKKKKKNNCQIDIYVIHEYCLCNVM